MYAKTIFAGAVILLVLISCGESSGEGVPLGTISEIPKKTLVSSVNAAVEALLFVDAETQNPLNAGEYILRNADGSETQFFNYVILSYAYLEKQRGYLSVTLTPSLKAILDNSVKYLKPLKEKGIKIVIEIRSGVFSDAEPGAQTGFGTMDVASIQNLITSLKALITEYGVDGFDFNDAGGGERAYPPYTEYLKQFQSDTPLYQERLFQDGDGNRLSEDIITAKLWREGGSNFSNLLQMTNENLKENYTWTLKNGSAKDTNTSKLFIRSILCHDTNHGRYLLDYLRNEYMPDAYSGADQSIAGNVRYIIHDTGWDQAYRHASLFYESENRDAGAERDARYAPFAVDLQNRPDNETALSWAEAFLQGDDPDYADGRNDTSKYGALVFSNLPAVSDAGYDVAEYLSLFSQTLFGCSAELSSGGNYR
ncbi:MAG: hypothetical protein LBG87_07235 [Spirochaetaceae bacterium]|jgi:hypothetical protein|nr:hypothetical protein [Spirochaetaceae bacterium]